jgi:hypothetical protein
VRTAAAATTARRVPKRLAADKVAGATSREPPSGLAALQQKHQH